jgi:Mg2+-importing ATPase
MTGASFLLPFLPMLPIQVLLNNLLYDISQVAIPSDEIDEEYVAKSRPWNIEYIRKFMMVFGPISSIFDFITFGVLWFIFHAKAALFHTGWFLESFCTQSLVIHIIRTGKKPFLESMPSQFLMFMSIYMITIAVVIPFTPLGHHFGFVMPPAAFFPVLIVIVAAYLFTVQAVKDWFIRQYGYE